MAATYAFHEFCGEVQFDHTAGVNNAGRNYLSALTRLEINMKKNDLRGSIHFNKVRSVHLYI